MEDKPVPALRRHLGDKQVTGARMACDRDRVLFRDGAIWFEPLPSQKGRNMRSHHLGLFWHGLAHPARDSQREGQDEENAEKELRNLRGYHREP